MRKIGPSATHLSRDPNRITSHYPFYEHYITSGESSVSGIPAAMTKVFLLEYTSGRLVNNMPSKFEIYKDSAEKFRFRIRAENGEIIATGEAYEQHAGVMKGVKVFRKTAIQKSKI
jgi:uncharacterized protein YegP (UPF0339 family)